MLQQSKDSGRMKLKLVRLFDFPIMLVTDLAPAAVTEGQVFGFILNSDQSI